MPRWIPEPKWNGRDVFIIGGGTSLRSFDWSLLVPEYTIGCNDAYTLGVDVCKICHWGDSKWFKQHTKSLEQSGCLVITSCPQFQKSTLPWLWLMSRENRGLWHTSLGWNACTGASAINLALVLGASRVLLLGFDMRLDRDAKVNKVNKVNWHENTVDEPNTAVYKKFVAGFERVARDLHKFKGTEIININDDSDLLVFPKIGVKEFWERRKTG